MAGNAPSAARSRLERGPRGQVPVFFEDKRPIEAENQPQQRQAIITRKAAGDAMSPKREALVACGVPAVLRKTFEGLRLASLVRRTLGMLSESEVNERVVGPGGQQHG